MLNIEQQIVLSERSTTLQEMIGNEPDNSLYKYFLEDSNSASDQKVQIVYSNYDSLVWGEVAKHLTSQKVKRIGIKTFPQVGAIGFFTLLNEERSKILAPVHHKVTKYATPTFTVKETDTTFIFHCSSPKDVTYVCYRIILRLDKFAHEYITYEETLEVPKPATTGTYDIYCVGYIHEGEAVSEDSTHYSVGVVGTQEDWPGPQENSDIFVRDIEITEENKVRFIRSDGFDKTSDNTVNFTGYATTQQLTEAIQAAINDSWEASY